MYCKHCGKEIDEGDRYCKYCGGELIVGDKQITNSGGDSIVVTKPKVKWYVVTMYCMWLVLNIGLLFGDKSSDATDIFFPFTEHKVFCYAQLCVPEHYDYYPFFDMYYYDWSEFIVYAIIIPLLIYCIYIAKDIIKKNKQN